MWLQEDQLFATLDPTTRSRKLPSGQEILLTDTVGFIRKLPHHLIDAFKSTLEEAKYADLILHVVDASNPQMDEQMYVVYETLQRLEAMDKPVVTAFNKMDRIGESLTVRDFKADRIVQVSAKTGEGLEALLQAIEEILREQKIYIERVYSYQESGKSSSSGSMENCWRKNTKKMESMYLHTCRKSLTGGYNRWLYSLFLEIRVRASHIIYMNISFGNQ